MEIPWSVNRKNAFSAKIIEFTVTFTHLVETLTQGAGSEGP